MKIMSLDHASIFMGNLAEQYNAFDDGLYRFGPD